MLLTRNFVDLKGRKFKYANLIRYFVHKFQTHSLAHRAEPFLRSRQLRSHSRVPSILRNPTVHYRIHKSHTLVPVLSQINSIHNIPVYLSKIHFNIVHPPTSLSPQWSLSFLLSNQHPICISLRPHSCYMPCQSHPPWLDHSNYTWRRVKVMKFLVMQFSPASFPQVTNN
jgi:hypothetical protein